MEYEGVRSGVRDKGSVGREREKREGDRYIESESLSAVTIGEKK